MTRIILQTLMIAGLLAAAAACSKMVHPAAPAARSEFGNGPEETDPKKILVARVNGAAITMQALVNMMNRLGPPRDSAREATVQKTKKAALDRLILEELAFQQAKARGIRMEPKIAEEFIDNLKKNLGGEQEYKAFLTRQDMTEPDIRAEFERSIALQQILVLEVRKKSVVPEGELKQEYEREKKRYVIPEKIVITDVFFPETGAGSGVHQRKAVALLKKLKSGPSRDPWQLVLDGTFLVRFLELNRVRHPDLYRTAKKMKPGELSDVISADDGFHIIVLESASAAKVLTFDEAKKSIEEQLRVSARQKRLLEWENELRQGAAIEILDQELKPEAKAGRISGDK